MAMWQSQIGNGSGTGAPVYTNVAAAQAATGSDNDQCLVASIDTYYRYEADGSAYTVDGTTVLSTGDAGNTRWLAIAGKYLAEPNYTMVAEEEPTGFPIDPSTGDIATADSTLTFTDGTLTLAIAPTGASFSFYIKGKKYTSTGDSAAITDTEGLWYIYYNDSGVLTATQTWDIDFIYSQALVAIVYWDAANNTAIYVGDERHGIKMDGHTHANLHSDIGTTFRSGCAISSLSTDQSGIDAAHAQFGVEAGAIRDEDLGHSLSAILSTTGLPIYYKDGASGYWRKTTNAGYSITTTGTGRMAYNQDLGGGAWQLTEIANNDFGLCHVFATNDINNPYFAIVGQADYGNVNAARAGANDEINNLVTSGLIFAEYIPIATVIFQTSNAYTGGTNTTKSRVRTTDLGDDYVDWRYSKISPSAISVTDHGNLSGLGVDDHLQYVPVDGLRDTTAISFETTGPYAGPTDPGALHWDDDSKTLTLHLDANSALQIGQETHLYVYNDSGAEIKNGKLVYISGVNSGVPEISKADASALASSFVAGMTTQDIDDAQYGYITMVGLVREVVTTGYAAGDVIWLDGSTPGEFTNTRPTSPTHQVFVGYILVVDAANGVIAVRPDVVPRLIGLSDVLNATPAAGDVPAWISGNSRFEMQNFNELSALMAAASELYYAGVKKLETTSDGVLVTADSNYITMESTGTGQNYGSRLRLKNTNAGLSDHAIVDIGHKINDAGNTTLKFEIVSRNAAAASQFSMVEYLFSNDSWAFYCGGEFAITAVKDASVELYYDAVKKLETTSTGAKVNSDRCVSIVDGTGTDQNDGARFQLKASSAGDSTHATTQLNQYISDAGNTATAFAISCYSAADALQFNLLTYNYDTDVLELRTGGELAVKATKDGAVELYHDAIKKLETASGGITLTSGATVNEFSTDGTLAGDSDTAVPTEKAVKTYAAPKLINEIVQASTDTLTAAEVSSTIINNYGQAAENTQTLPAAAKGYNGMCVIGTAGAGAFHLKAGASDKIYLDGTALDDGDKVSLATPAVGDYFTFWTFQTGASSYDWIVTTGSGTLTDGGA